MQTSDQQTLQELEESLWREETRFDKGYMDKLLAEDFFEFGRSGRIYSREQCLSAPKQAIHAVLPLKDFRLHQVAENVVLLTYVSQVQYEETEIANRSSLWSQTADGWRLRFHQGTPVMTNDVI